MSSLPKRKETGCGHTLLDVMAMALITLEHTKDGKEDVLVLTEVFMRWLVAIFTKDQSEMSVVKALLKMWIPTLGFHTDFTPTMARALRLKLFKGYVTRKA